MGRGGARIGPGCGHGHGRDAAVYERGDSQAVLCCYRARCPSRNQSWNWTSLHPRTRLPRAACGRYNRLGEAVLARQVSSISMEKQEDRYLLSFSCPCLRCQ